MSELAPVKSFTGLATWQEGHKLVLSIYAIVKQFPTSEQYILTSQLLRAAISITSNIAEGFSRKIAKDKIQFYRIALGSLTECQNQLLIAKDLSYISHKDFQTIAKQTVNVGKLLNSLIASTTKLKTSI